MSDLTDFIASQHQQRANGYQGGRKKAATAEDGEFSDYVLPRPKLPAIALHGQLGRMAEAACSNSEAVPASVAIHILARFAATLGRTAYIQIGDHKRHLRMFSLIVGPTAKGRKGTSSEMPNRLFESVHSDYLVSAGFLPLEKLTALSTGEGLIQKVRDPYSWTTGDKEHNDPGVSDKRLLCDISEFAGVLAQGRREGATLSTVLRDAFDGVVMTTPSATAFRRASDTHVCVVGSVPETEIVKNLNDVEKTNGFANRFPMFYSARTKIVPSPKPTDPMLMAQFARHVADAIWFGSRVGLVEMDDDALSLWETTLYRRIEDQTYPELIDSLLGRRSLHTMIFAALIALFDHKSKIDADHLLAADAWMEYWEQTVLFVFSTAESNEKAIKDKALQDQLVKMIDELGGVKVSHTALATKATNKYQRRDLTAVDVKRAMEALQRESPPRIHTETMTTAGRPANYYTLIDLYDASDE
jgi:hypothetical protein